MYVLDNKVLKELLQAFEEYKINYQLIPPTNTKIIMWRR